MSPARVQELIDDTSLELRVAAGEGGLERTIDVPRIQKPGLALTGYGEQLHRGRALCLGGTEIDYFSTLDPPAQTRAVDTVMASSPATLVVTRGLEPPQQVRAACDRDSVPLLRTDLPSAEFIMRIKHWLDIRLAETTTVHGVMVDVLEVGILLLGPSGIGKSEAALDLVERGHRLVADDLVTLMARTNGTLVGQSSGDLGHHMEIRGLGIINIAELFGITAVRGSKRLDLVIEMSEWDETAEYDRLGVDDARYRLLGVEVPFVQVPVRPGRNLASIIEVAARNRLLRYVGRNSSRDFIERIEGRLRQQAQVKG